MNWNPHHEISLQLLRHTPFRAAFRRCLAVDTSPPGTMYFVVGPSGAGKTRMAQLVGERLYGEPGPKLPWVKVSAQNTTGGYFHPKYLIGQILDQMADPFRGNGALFVKQHTGAPDSLDVRSARVPSEEAMRTAVVRLAGALSCRLLIIDEANIIVLQKKGRPVESHMESLRTLALEMRVRVLLLGTLRMLDFVDYSAQISRLGRIIHLDRIDGGTPEGANEFLQLLASIEQQLEAAPGSLTGLRNEIYNATYGILGEVVALLDRARMDALAVESAEVLPQHIVGAMQPQLILDRMRAEADQISRFVQGMRMPPPDPEPTVRRRRARR